MKLNKKLVKRPKPKPQIQSVNIADYITSVRKGEQKMKLFPLLVLVATTYTIAYRKGARDLGISVIKDLTDRTCDNSKTITPPTEWKHQYK